MITVACLALAAWIYLIAFHGLFWRSTPVLADAVPSGQARVAIVVPARDEAESIRQCLNSLLAQDYAGPLSVILVDDNSSDGTGQIASSLAASLRAGERLTVLSGQPLPPRWSGKLWAVHQGLAHPAAQAADYVLLTDADIVHAPDHLSRLIAKAESERLDLVSEMVRLNCSTFAERALIPAFVFFFQMLYPFAWVANPARRTAGAAGGTMLVSRAALDRIDGVTRIRHHLIDDCALAKEVKSTGGRIWLGHSEDTISLRVYPAPRDIWSIIARTAYVQLNHSPLLLLGCILAMSVIYCAPPLLALTANGLARLLALLAWLLMALAFQPTLRRYRSSPAWGLALPLVGLFYLCATVGSAIRHHAGRGGGWKNRVYPEHPHA
jgi:hopene-associated glycosyltransferase HpnB